jgi:hypothetical protein
MGVMQTILRIKACLAENFAYLALKKGGRAATAAHA